MRGAPPVGAPGAQKVRAPQVGPQPLSSDLDRQARAIQARAFSTAEGAESAATRALRDLERRTGGELAGLDFRLKADGDRTIEKILEDVAHGDALEEARKVKDALRYTLVYDPDRYWAQVTTVHRELDRLGYTTVKWKPNWTNPLSHDVNTAFRAPDGARFELQFHTPLSWERKMTGGPGGQRSSHSIYEELRKLPDGSLAREAALKDELRRLWSDVPAPPGSTFVPPIDPDLFP